MEIIYKLGDFPDPGDRNLYNGIEAINKNNFRSAFKHFKKGFNYDNEYASLFLAIFYYTGFGLAKREPEKAFSLFKDISLQWNNPIAQYFIATIYLHGDDNIPEDTELGLYWLLLASDNGWMDATVNLGISYWYYGPIEKDHKKAVACFEKVARSEKNYAIWRDDAIAYLFENINFKVKFTKFRNNAIYVKSAMDYNVRWPVEWLFLPNNVGGESIYSGYNQMFFWSLLINKKFTTINASQLCLSVIYKAGHSVLCEDINKKIYWTKEATKNVEDIMAYFYAIQFYEAVTSTTNDPNEIKKTFFALVLFIVGVIIITKQIQGILADFTYVIYETAMFIYNISINDLNNIISTLY